MQGVFICYNKIDYSKPSGIDKKVINQVKVFNDNGLDTKIYYMNKTYQNSIRKFFSKLLAVLPYGNSYPVWNDSKTFNHLDFIYLRRPIAYNCHMINLLSNIKKRNPNIKIILEIPTFPYNKEYRIKYIPFLFKDLLNRKKLKKVIDRISTPCDYQEIFGIKTLKFTNSVDIDTIKVRKPEKNDENIINICGISSLETWHGYERIIKGLRTYKEKNCSRKIKVYIVGDGPERKKYEKLVDKFELKNEIKFLGWQTGERLEKIYNKCDLSLDVFGMYKKNMNIAASLKSREYLAKGIPIIIGCDVDIIQKDFPYYLKFPNNDTEIDFDKVIAFYDKIYKFENKEDVVNKIRDYSYKVCNISTSMNSIINYLKQNQ